MANERQTDLILRAQVDQALAPLSQVTQRVKDLIAVLNQQGQAAQTGDTTLGNYAKALRDVEKASGDLLKQRAALDNFATRGQKVDAQQNVVDQRQSARDTFAASLPANATDAQTAALAKLDKALASSQGRLETVTIAYQKAADQLQRLGVLSEEAATNLQRADAAALEPAHELISSYVLLASEALRAGQAQNDTLLVTLRTAAVEKQVAAQREQDAARFAASQEKERQAVLDAADAIRAKGAAAQAAVDAGTATNRRQDDVQAALAEADAEAKLASERARDAAAFQAEQEKNRQTVIALAQAIREQGAAAQAAVDAGTAANRRQAELEAAFSGRSQAATAAEAAAASRVAGLGSGPLATPPSAVAQVGAVTGATRDSVQATADTSAAVDKLNASMGAGTLTAQSYNRAMDTVFALQRQIASDAGLIDAFTRQAAAVNAATIAQREAELEVARLVALFRTEEGELADLVRAEKAAEAAAANLQKQIAQQAALDAQLRARNIDTRALDAETIKLVATMERLSAVQARAQQGNGTVLGLSSYQLQNLSFQVNDVITQLSLGQGVLRTFESQAGQIFQVFETSISAMQRLLLFALPAAAAIALVALSLERVAETTAAQRQFAAQLAGTVDGATHSAAALTALQRETERTGVAFADAGAAITTFLHEGLDDDRIKQFTTAARNLSQALGIDFNDAVKKISGIPTASIDDLEKLLLEYGALTPELQKYLETQRKGGDIDLARAATIDALSNRFVAARTQGIGPLTDSFTGLKNAFHDLEDAIGSETLLLELIANVKLLIEGISTVTGLVKSFGSVLEGLVGTDAFKALVIGIKAAIDPIGALLSQYRALQAARDKALAGGPAQKSDLTVDTLQAKLLLAQHTLEDFKAKLTTGDAGDNPVLARFAKQVEDIKTQLDAAITKRNILMATGPEGGPTTLPGVTTGTASNAANIALQHIGQGPSEVTSFLKGQNIDPIVQAWCAAFANAALAQAGIQGSGSNIATSFEKWGSAVVNAAQVQSGDVVVMSRGHPAGEKGGHVGLATGNFKTAPDGTLLVEMVSGNLSGAVGTSFERADQVDIRRAGRFTGQTFSPPSSGLADPTQAGTAQSRNQLEQVHLQQQIDAQVNAALLGNSQARIDQDNRIADLEKIRVQKEADQIRGNAVENQASIDLRARLDATYRANQKNERDKQDAEVKQRADAAARALDDAVANADPTNADAKRKAAANKAQAAFDTLDTLVAQGVQQIAGMPIDAFRAQLEKLKAQAIGIATVEADTAIIDAAVKERDTKITTIKAQLEAGTLTLADAFSQTALVVAASAPKIKDAITKSNADLAAQPQTPRITERLAQNAKVNPNDPTAFSGIDTAALSKINSLVASRNELVATYNQLVKVGAIDQDEADKKINDAYAKTTPQIISLSVELQKQLNIQKELGVISPEAYDKISAKLKEVAADTTHLTKLQQLLSDGIAGSVISNAINAFNTIATAIGNAISGTAKWSDVLGAVGQAFAQFAAGVLKDIAGILIKYELLLVLKSALGIGPGGGGGAAHAGGVAGALTQSRSGLDPSTWIGAPRAHGGGLAGLAHGEVPVIVQTGEEILTAKDPRHRNNYNPNAGAGQTPASIRNVLLFDANEVAGAMAGASGEKVTLTHIKRNAPALRQILGVGGNK